MTTTTNWQKTILVTGGCGFVGSNMVTHLVRKYPQFFILNLDKLDYCASLKLLTSIENAPNYEFVKGDILDTSLVSFLLRKYNVTALIHFAAQTHVDNSFGNSLQFTTNNVLGVHTLLECSKLYGKLERFVHVSTDEVYGTSAHSGQGAVESQTVLQPTNPYAASKAGAEHIVMSYFKSWKFPVIITRSNNIYGPHQIVDKNVQSMVMDLTNVGSCMLMMWWQLMILFCKRAPSARFTIFNRNWNSRTLSYATRSSSPVEKKTLINGGNLLLTGPSMTYGIMWMERSCLTLDGSKKSHLMKD